MQSHEWPNTSSATAAGGTNAQGGERLQEEQRDPDSHNNSHRQSESARFDSMSHLASIRWDTEAPSSTASIWSARQEDSRSFQSSYGSVGSSGPSRQSRLYGNELQVDVVSKMSDISISQQPQPRASSLRMAANRYKNNASSTIIPSGSSSVTSTGTSIPGLTTAFSGSASQYSSSNYNPPSTNLFVAPTASSGPPPGFLSPITSSNQRQASAGPEDLDTSVGSIGTSRSHSSRRTNQSNRSRGRNNNSSIHGNDSMAKNDSMSLKCLKDPNSSLQSAFSMASSKTPVMSGVERPILPHQPNSSTTATTWDASADNDSDMDDDDEGNYSGGGGTTNKKKSWLVRMNRRLAEIPIGELDPYAVPLSAVMNGWAKTKSSQGATMVEMWLNRAQEEYEAGNTRIVLTTKMYTMAGTDVKVCAGSFGVSWTVADSDHYICFFRSVSS